LRIGPPDDQKGIEKSLAALLDARPYERLKEELPGPIKGESQAEKFSLVRKQREGLAQFVLLHQIVNEGDGIFCIAINPQITCSSASKEANANLIRF